jgi:hypothetical protein
MVWSSPLLDGRQFKDDWREIATQVVFSGMKEDRKCLAALEVLFAAANKEFKWCPESSVPHASPNACPDCCRIIKTTSHRCRVIGRLEETSAKLWYSAEARQQSRVKRMPKDRSVFWSALDMFLSPRGEQLESPRIRLLQEQQLKMAVEMEGLENRLRAKGDEIERLEKVSAEQVDEIKRLKIDLGKKGDTVDVLQKALEDRVDRLEADLKKNADEVIQWRKSSDKEISEVSETTMVTPPPPSGP